MPYSVRVEPGTSYLFLRLFGDYGFADARDMLRELTQTQTSLAGKQVICDCRQGSVTLSLQDLLNLATYFQQHGQVFAGVRWAMVVPGVLEYGLARSAGLMVADVPFDYNVFHDVEEACIWAGVPPNRMPSPALAD